MQLDQQWLHTYGFQGRRLFLSHRSIKKTKQSKGVVPEQLPDSSSSSPASEWASSLEQDVLSCASEDSNSHPRELLKSHWYEHVIQGTHLAEVRRLQSFICGGKSDWSKDLAKIKKKRSKTNQTVPHNRLQLRAKRLGLLEARDRAFKGKRRMVDLQLCRTLILCTTTRQISSHLQTMIPSGTS